MSLLRAARAVRQLGGFAGGTSRLTRPPTVLDEPDVRPSSGLVHVGTIVSYIAAALSPDGTTLYVNHDGSEVIAYTFPGLVPGATVITPNAVGGEIGSLACDDDGVLYWWENTNGAGTNLYASTDPTTPIYATVDEQSPLGLAWSPYDGLLYGFGMVDVTEGQVLSSWDPSIAGGDRQLVYDPSGSEDTIDWFNSTVATADGNIWFTTPVEATPAAFRIRQWSIPLADFFTSVQVIRDAVVPGRDNRTYYYGDPSGAEPAAGYSLDFEHTRSSAPDFDGFAPGQRAVAYTPTFHVVAFERGDTGEVWTYAA